MIGTLRGPLTHKSATEIIIEAGGVGYRVMVPLTVLSDLPQLGQEVYLHVHTYVREDAMHLYGFMNEGEKRAFVTLLGISGIGPKVALNIISGIPYEEFQAAVENEDITRLTRISGLGKKTANRIVLELKGKLPRDGGAPDTGYDDALSALVNLGYKKTEASDALQAARKDGHDEIEAVIREALKRLSPES